MHDVADQYGHQIGSCTTPSKIETTGLSEPRDALAMCKFHFKGLMGTSMSPKITKNRK